MKTFHCIETAATVAARSSGASPSDLPSGTYYVDNGELCISYLQFDVPEQLWPFLVYCCEQIDGGYEVHTPLREGFSAPHGFAGWPIPTNLA